VQLLHSSLDELKKLNTTLLDEHTALQLAFSSLEDKMRSIQVSFVGLVPSYAKFIDIIIVVALLFQLFSYLFYLQTLK